MPFAAVTAFAKSFSTKFLNPQSKARRFWELSPTKALLTKAGFNEASLYSAHQRL